MPQNENKDDGTRLAHPIDEESMNLSERTERLKHHSGSSGLTDESSGASSSSSDSSDEETPIPKSNNEESTNTFESLDSGVFSQEMLSQNSSSVQESRTNTVESQDSGVFSQEMLSQDSGLDTTDSRNEPEVATTVTVELPLHEIRTSHKPCFMPSQMDLNLKFAMHRLFTYPVYWNLPVSKEQLANSGFFLTEGFNSVQCYFCMLEITERFDWDHMEVTIDLKHRELNPECPLMRGEDTTNIPINDPTNFRYEAHRLHSLLTTDWNHPVTPFDLAKHGFYWTGSSDNCRCAFCRLEVRGWEEGDTAEGEHRRWNPNCVFMNGRAVGNVPIGREISDDAVISDEAGMATYQSPFSINPFARSELSTYGQIKYTNCTGPRPPVETLGVTPLNPPKHPEYTTLQSRVNSYKMWPMSLPQKPHDLAEAGFYYIGTGDRVICFQCGGGLKDWAATDTPWCEHAKWFSRCPYLLLKKGKHYVDQTLKDQEIEMPVQAFQEALANTLQQDAQAASAQSHVAETKDVEEGAVCSLKCKLCGERDIETVYLPCGHMVSCMECIDKETVCLTCKQTRVAYVRTFLQ